MSDQQEFFDRGLYDLYTLQGVKLHTLGNFQAALRWGRAAYKIAPDNSSERAQAARNMGARYDKLGYYHLALANLQEAYDFFDKLVEDAVEPDPAMLRERGVSAMYVAISGLRAVLRDRDAGIDSEHSTDDISMMRSGWDDLRRANKLAGRHMDQYQINMARRLAVAEAMADNRRYGFGASIRAIVLAPLSESPRLDTASRTMSRLERLRAKGNALALGTFALSANLLGNRGNGRAARFGRRLANHVL